MARLIGGNFVKKDIPGKLFWGLQYEGRTDSEELAAYRAGLKVRIPIRSTEDIVKARQVACLLAEKLGSSGSQKTLIRIAISELARNIILYAGSGKIILSGLNGGDPRAMVVEALDRGPGIADLQCALAGGFSTSGGLGLGLSGLKRIVDQFEISSQPGEGTRVLVRICLG